MWFFELACIHLPLDASPLGNCFNRYRNCGQSAMQVNKGNANSRRLMKYMPRVTVDAYSPTQPFEN